MPWGTGTRRAATRCPQCPCPGPEGDLGPHGLAGPRAERDVPALAQRSPSASTSSSPSHPDSASWAGRWGEVVVSGGVCSCRTSATSTRRTSELSSARTRSRKLHPGTHPPVQRRVRTRRGDERRVAARVPRQEGVERGPRSPLFRKRRHGGDRPGGPDVLRTQLQRLLELAQLRHVAVQVTNTSCEKHAGRPVVTVCSSCRTARHRGMRKGSSPTV
ncbi:Scr1 family TA system antitoxin-like transcriptional regulator [Streptomyces sp. NPDC007063]|uniref:Scr1 family TA system antitoxin-like transcriptional regulator n=1 Tax=Streptomyces sp. NPDC007063 TaxID=3364772 RepID=UPI0036869F25